MLASKTRSVFRCSACGAERVKWAGRCDRCEAWNTLVEATVTAPSARRRATPLRANTLPPRLSEVSVAERPRYVTGLREFDFVLGGGIVPGSVVLVGGEPGIGKSTLLMQVAGALEARGVSVLYVSGEESPEQLRLRAVRLGEASERIHAIGETVVEAMIEQSRALGAQVVVVDSIQTSYTEGAEGAPGNAGQVRESAARLMRFAKDDGPSIIMVGHVTKGGGIAGPKTLEHIVDTVLYFEGESTLDHRILRATKNRFGSVDEIGVFEITSEGLIPVANPSATFLAARTTGIAGSAITAVTEGSRAILVEIQALTAKAGFGTPQRVANGLDHRRLAVLLAVLERRAGIPFGELDVFVNVTGGVRLLDPSTDLAVIAAIVSSVTDAPAPAEALFLGEVGLGGEVRPVSGVDRKLSEAARLGFTRIYLSDRTQKIAVDIVRQPLRGIRELVEVFTG